MSNFKLNSLVCKVDSNSFKMKGSCTNENLAFRGVEKISCETKLFKEEVEIIIALELSPSSYR